MSQYDAIASIMLNAYSSVGDYRAFHMEQCENDPPTLFAKLHHLRSVVQSSLTKSERFQLHGDWTEYGRVQYEDLEHSEVLLLRSKTGITIEKERRQREALFHTSAMIQSEVRLLAYQFQREGLELNIAGTTRQQGKSRLIASGVPVFVGLWSYDYFDPANGPFPQGKPDLFGELGHMDIDDAARDQI